MIQKTDQNSMSRPSLFSFTLDELRGFFVSNSLAKYAADQVYNWIYKHHQFETDKWTNVSKKVKAFVQNDMEISLPKASWMDISEDGTIKFLVEMQDGNTVETVLIPAKERATLCVSSQVGCAVGCAFCHTGTMGLIRNLSTEEVIGQYLAVIEKLKDLNDERIAVRAPTNIVFMGQGEPLHNFNNMKKATNVLMEDKGPGLGQRKITLSTSGYVPQIEKLSDFPPVNIAISLHACRDEVRSELMPINRQYDLSRLFSALKKIPLKAHRSITYQYLLMEGINDGMEDVEGLAGLLDRKNSKINIIPFNEYPDSRFERPSDAKILWFQNQLINRGFVCTTRLSKGRDIQAACGQLKSRGLTTR